MLDRLDNAVYIPILVKSQHWNKEKGEKYNLSGYILGKIVVLALVVEAVVIIVVIIVAAN